MSDPIERRVIPDRNEQAALDYRGGETLNSGVVASPQQARVFGTDAPTEALDYAMRVGGEVLQAEHQKKVRRDYVSGKILSSQGETLTNLRKNMASPATIKGFRAMEASTDSMQWFNAQAAEIENADKELAPDEYREKLVSSLERIQSDDPETQRLIDAIAAEYLPKLASAQITQHEAWKKDKTIKAYTDHIFSAGGSAATDDATVDSMLDMSNRVAGMSEDEQKAAIVEATAKGLAMDQVRLYERLAEGGFKGLEARQIEALRSRYDAYQVEQANKFSRELTLEFSGLLNNVQLGRIGEAAAVDQAIAMRDKYAKNDKWLSSVTGQITAAYRGYANQRASEARSEAKLNAREAERAAAEAAKNEDLDKIYAPITQRFMMELSQNVITGDLDIDAALELVEEYGKELNLNDTTLWRKAASDVLNAEQQRWGEHRTQAAAAARAQAIEDQKNAEATLALSGGAASFGAAKPEVQKLAMNIAKQSIVQQAIQNIPGDDSDPEIEAQRADYVMANTAQLMMEYNYVDPAIKGSMSATLGGNFLDPRTNRPSEAAQRNFAVWGAMYAQNRQLAEKYLPDEETLQLAIQAYEFDTSMSDTEAALSQALQNRNTDPRSLTERREATERALRDPNTQGVLDGAIGNYFGGMAQNNSLLSGGLEVLLTDSTRDDWKYSDPRVSQETVSANPLVKDMLKREFANYKNMYPQVSNSVAAQRATDIVMSRTAIIGNSVVFADKSEPPLKEQMGLGEFANYPGVENAAVMAYLREFGNNIWPGKWEERQENLKGTFFLNPVGDRSTASAEGTGLMGDIDVRYDHTQRMFLITPKFHKATPSRINALGQAVADLPSDVLNWATGTAERYDEVMMDTYKIEPSQIGEFFRNKMSAARRAQRND